MLFTGLLIPDPLHLLGLFGAAGIGVGAGILAASFASQNDEKTMVSQNDEKKG
jgi:hypothetical protein